MLFSAVGRNEPPGRTPVDWAWVHVELRKAGVTQMLLCAEYQRAAAERNDGTRPYQYSQFCDLYAEWRKTLASSMRQVHRAGEKLFVDYSGKRPHIVDPKTGEITYVELFVAVLGASNYTYAEATRSQKKHDFVASTIRTLEYIGGVPELVVPDQLRDRESLATKRRSKAACSSCSDGSSPAFVTVRFSASMSSMRRSPSCSKI